MAGIGCHYMAIWMDRKTDDLHAHGRRRRDLDRPGAVHRRRSTSSRTSATAPTSTPGILAIRAAVAAKVNITYKILYNDAVAMTGGQPVDGPLSCRRTSRSRSQPKACRRSSWSPTSRRSTRRGYFEPAIAIHHRDELDAVQRELREVTGMSVLIYDQTCAAEKRRRRKRGKFADPAKRVVINELVCEGCGDCGVKSNCVSVLPVETEFGRKRAIDQSLVQQGLFLRQGLLPELRHGRRRPAAQAEEGAKPPISPTLPDAGAARHARAVRHPRSPASAAPASSPSARCSAWPRTSKARACTVLDMTGLAQKGGAVISHVRIADTPEQLHATRIAAGEAEARARLRHPDRRRRRSAREDADGRRPRRSSTRRWRCRRDVHARSRPAVPDRLDGAGDQGRRRPGRCRLRRCARSSPPG